ncbi:MAG: NADH-quinone oxidoreductase subunit H 1 [Gemmatales bacterium]|nr:MAG: NADH-quinone oxidoreductase subunit H 1 [Gemmatales bacterium]
MHEFHWTHTLITVVVVLAVIMGACAYLILLERKTAAFIQDRLGPNRVGPHGLLQPIADGLKFLFKEEVIPRRADRLLFLMAPAVAMGTALFAFAVVPFGPTSVPPDPPPPDATMQQVRQYEIALAEYKASYQFVIAPGLDIGILFVFAIGSLSVYGVILGGWASNNKYSFIGGLRSSAQLISYEIPLGLSVLGVLLMAGSLNLERILDVQTRYGWFILYQPLAFLLFLVSAFAETNRLPFDLAEAEQELVGGFHTEYSGLKFGMFFLGEYTHMITTSFLLSILFLGGWHCPFLAEPAHTGMVGTIVKLMVLALKVFGFIMLYMIIRWTIPRFRFDQLMALAWKVLIPLALANFVCVVIVQEFGWSWVWLTLASIALFFGAGYFGTRSQTTPQPV